MATMKTCLKCGIESEVEDSPLVECPRCGAIYARVEAALAKKQMEEAERLRKADEQIARIEAADRAAAERKAAALERLTSSDQGSQPSPRKSSGHLKFVILAIFGIAMFTSIVSGMRTESARSHIDRSAPSRVTDDAAIEAETKQQELRCREDAKCWAERHMSDATRACRGPIEKLAKWDFQWTDGWMDEGIFNRYQSLGDSSEMLYWGDKLKLQNAFGAWKHVRYKCVYDIARDREISVDVLND